MDIIQADPTYSKYCTYQSDMNRRKAPGGMPVTYTIGIFKTAFEGAEPLVELLHNLSPESDESEVIGTAVGMLCLPRQIMAEIIISSWLLLPLSCWWKELSVILSTVRRCGMLGAIADDSLLSLRKFKNLTIRVKDDPDLSVEAWNRGFQVTRKHLFGKAGRGSISGYVLYEKAFHKRGQELLNKTWNKLPEDIQRETIFEFWEERAVRGATGASKTINKQALVEIVLELAKSDRPGKKVLAEMLDDHALHRVMEDAPSQRAYYLSNLSLAINSEPCMLLSMKNHS